MWTPRQQGPFRVLVKRAWAAHCALQPGGGASLLADARRRDEWYREQLHEAIGCYSTKEAHPVRDYARAMAHFETFLGDSVYWQLRAGSDHQRRAEFALRKLMREHDVEETYVAGIASKMFDQGLAKLTGGQLARVTIALRIHLGRQKAAPVPAGVAEEDNPF